MKYTVYRGQYCGNKYINSLLPSISFGDKETALKYATNPNRRGSIIIEPLVFKCNITIENPIINNMDESFIDFIHLINNFSLSELNPIILELEHRIMSTDNWIEKYSNKYTSVNEALIIDNNIILDLYVEAYYLLDNKEFINLLTYKGYDGAIFRGNGFTSNKIEYRVFCKKQLEIISITSIVKY
jgi:hypothetical protein